MSQVLDQIFGENEGEDTEQHSDSDEQVSEEEDNVEYHPEDTDTSDESDWCSSSYWSVQILQ